MSRHPNKKLISVTDSLMRRWERSVKFAAYTTILKDIIVTYLQDNFLNKTTLSKWNIKGLTYPTSGR